MLLVALFHFPGFIFYPHNPNWYMSAFPTNRFMLLYQQSGEQFYLPLGEVAYASPMHGLQSGVIQNHGNTFHSPL